MRVLMVGDVIGNPGRLAVASLVPRLRSELALDLVIANGENSAGGRGLTRQTVDDLLAVGVDAITSGNHVWAHREAETLLEQPVPVIRPLNFPTGAPGRGVLLVTVRQTPVRIINLMGCVNLGQYDNPFHAIDHYLFDSARCPVTIVDFHAEATSEKVAMGWHLDGRVTAVLGTHTHVPTADARLLPSGTAVVTDVGMVGPVHSVIGSGVDAVLRRFLTQMPTRLTVPGGPVAFNAVLLTIDDTTGRASRIERIDRHFE